MTKAKPLEQIATNADSPKTEAEFGNKLSFAKKLSMSLGYAGIATVMAGYGVMGLAQSHDNELIGMGMAIGGFISLGTFAATAGLDLATEAYRAVSRKVKE